MKKFLIVCLTFLSFISAGFAQTLSAPATVASGQPLIISAAGETMSSYFFGLDYLLFPAYTTVPANQSITFGSLTAASTPYFTSGQQSKYSITLSLVNPSTTPVSVTFNLRAQIGNSSGNAFYYQQYSITVSVTPAQTNFSSAAKQGTFTKNNCGSGYQGSQVTYAVSAGAYSSTISQADADQKAINDVNNNGQNYANSHGQCNLVYYSTAQSGTFYSNECADYGGAGLAYTYNVAAGAEQSIISQADADQKAVNKVNNEGQANANLNGLCVSAFKIEVQSANNVGDNATASLVFKSTSPSGGQYEFQLTYPDSSTSNFGPQARNLIRFTATQSGQYQITARYIDASGNASNWLPISFSVQ